ncbi:MAG: hypothetical protein LUQ19_05440 [Methanoregula sp.]|nr:hypothetical protein [Methanoregula sp.]
MRKKLVRACTTPLLRILPARTWASGFFRERKVQGLIDSCSSYAGSGSNGSMVRTAPAVSMQGREQQLNESAASSHDPGQSSVAEQRSPPSWLQVLAAIPCIVGTGTAVVAAGADVGVAITGFGVSVSLTALRPVWSCTHPAIQRELTSSAA